MKIFDDKPWTYHLVAPLLLGALFGCVDFMRGEAPLSVLVPNLVRSTFGACLIWFLMVPTTTLVNLALQKSLPSLSLRLVIACAVGAMPISILTPWLYVTLGFATSRVPMDSTFIVQHYVRIFIITTLIWPPLTYWWYRRQLQETDSAPDTAPIPEVVAQAVVPVQDTPKPELPAFLKKLSPPVQDIPIAIKAEQNYIRIYLQDREELILYRFSDAVQSLLAFKGMQVHRSYWIAESAIAEINRTGKSYELTLHNGMVVPVSRTFKAQIDKLT